MGAPVLAALATIPRRAGYLDRVLPRIRQQVDRLAVYLNGYDDAPAIVRELADDVVHDRENGGAERKLHWAASHDGICLSCDDDIIYPVDYAARMVAAVQQWEGRALVAAHGRVYLDRPRNVGDIRPGSKGLVHRLVTHGRWVNHCGSGVMAWDARIVKVPTSFPHRNMVDMQVALWAQAHEIPIWLVAHASRWIQPLNMLDPAGIFRTSAREGHRRRNELLRTTTWRLHTLDP